MPRPGPRRPNIGVRMDDALVSRLDHMADQRGMKRSELVRILLEYALENMPDNWMPDSR